MTTWNAKLRHLGCTTVHSILHNQLLLANNNTGVYTYRYETLDHLGSLLRVGLLEDPLAEHTLY